ncbi:unnamed protein product [Adineta steineri]|uniref:Ubiquitin-like domain-containing protein n=1 Tax=Adineta steineri TaxID=433720 RepID=A0A814IY19_9BILA|nr:unnamed protein product [Adineta steineri]CAF1030652.1 unnamed protein product [Adineta steineri]CAF1101714.1 unnamed protein product [Adineta steineri]CAF1105631.1 unnamed protein product [Adineta steineri]CAF1114884.1 unnamed protein product [Adineta steineri]
MSRRYSQTPLRTARPFTSTEHIYTKIQVHYADNIEDIVIKTDREPTCGDLAGAIQKHCRVPVGKQMVYFRGQELHQHNVAGYQRPLSRYGMFSGNLVRLVGRRGLL